MNRHVADSTRFVDPPEVVVHAFVGSDTPIPISSHMGGGVDYASISGEVVAFVDRRRAGYVAAAATQRFGPAVGRGAAYATHRGYIRASPYLPKIAKKLVERQVLQRVAIGGAKIAFRAVPVVGTALLVTDVVMTTKAVHGMLTE